MIWGVCKQRKSPLATPGDLAMDKMADFFFKPLVFPWSPFNRKNCFFKENRWS